MNGLSGDGVNNWSVGYDLKKLNTFGLSVKDMDLSKLSPAERKAMQFMTLQTLDADVDRLLASMLKQSSLKFNAGEQARIRYSLRNEFLKTFKPYISGAESVDVAKFETNHRSWKDRFGKRR